MIRYPLQIQNIHLLFHSMFLFFLISCTTKTISFAPTTSVGKKTSDTAEDEPVMVQDALDVFAKYACQTCHGDSGGFGLHLNVLKDGVSTTGMPYITIENPDESYLYVKIIGDERMEGDIMPLGTDTSMTDDDIETIYLWIEQGCQGL